MDFDAVYREYRPRIFRYLSQLTCEADAHDLTQAVFLKVSHSLESFRGDSSLATWLYRIATNCARDFADSGLVRQREAEYLPEEPDGLEVLAATREPHAEDRYLREEMNDCIRGMVRDMPESYREVLMLSEFAELSNAEIADVLSVSVDTVKIRLHRARKTLRTAMECQCSLYHDERSELMCDRK